MGRRPLGGDGGFDFAQEAVTLYGQGVHRAFIRF